ncbi:serine hydrolase domain-containing protein [Caldalkalibacillus salinus]|uniref:serine hydrolase domain-containing protein n=1 Tax=Caldalkalibacillus salinus TaxID=2803787 RepID=UPI00192425D3|nr:serine hydrolase domain-containing protein [Caldalkalibacillus salinus]
MLEYKLSTLLRDAIQKGLFPGGVMLVEQDGYPVMHQAMGEASTYPERRALSTAHIFDLASLTKIVTTTLILMLIQEDKIRLQTPVLKHLSWLGKVGEGVTIQHLLTHTSGYRAWQPFYVIHKNNNHSIEDTLKCIEREADPATDVIYSDANFILLGKVIEAIEKQNLSQVLYHRLVRPLNLSGLQYRPSHEITSQMVPTEFGNRIEAEMVSKRKQSFEHFRQNVIWGEVNDGNSYYFLQGIAGHAGLFGTATDVAAIARLYMMDNPWLSSDIQQLALRDYTPNASVGRALGWVYDREQTGGFYHTGFTGTSVWVDPSKKLSAVIMTSRLHQDKPKDINSFRKACHQVVTTCL